MRDQQRQILHEFDNLAKESEKFRSFLEVYTDCFKLVEPKELLIERKKEFDYKLTKILNNNGYKNLGVRDKLDRVWNNMEVPKQGKKKYLRPLSFLVMPIANSDKTIEMKIVIWDMYIENVRELVITLTN